MQGKGGKSNSVSPIRSTGATGKSGNGEIPSARGNKSPSFQGQQTPNQINSSMRGTSANSNN